VNLDVRAIHLHGILRTRQPRRSGTVDTAASSSRLASIRSAFRSGHRPASRKTRPLSSPFRARVRHRHETAEPVFKCREVVRRRLRGANFWGCRNGDLLPTVPRIVCCPQLSVIRATCQPAIFIIKQQSHAYARSVGQLGPRFAAIPRSSPLAPATQPI
jgi:hypothetical protein